MSLAKRAFELQQVDLLIQSQHKQLEDMDLRLNHNTAVEQAQVSLASAENSCSELEKQYKDLDAEAEALKTNITRINEKLYGGKIKNPKELLSFEQEAGMFKATLSKKDDTLLEMMENIEAYKQGIKKLQEIYTAAASAWDKEKAELQVQSQAIKAELTGLDTKHKEILSALDKDTLAAYEGIRGRKGIAVVKVEQGRCLGCRVTLSISELQRVRGNAIVLCDNCGRIMYLS